MSESAACVGGRIDRSATYYGKDNGDVYGELLGML